MRRKKLFIALVAIPIGCVALPACALDGVRETLVGDDGPAKRDTVVVHDTVVVWCHKWDPRPECKHE
jgi:hypothetical protein